MNLVSKADIKDALTEKINIGTKEDPNFVDATIKNIDESYLRKFLVVCIGNYFTRVGHNLEKAGGSTFSVDTATILAADMGKTMTHVRISEIRLAMEYGAKGVFGDVKHCCATSIGDYILYFMQLKERNIAKEEIAAELNLKQLSEKATPWTEEDHVKAMRERYLENLNLVDQGFPIRDLGGLLFIHLLKEELIEMSIDDETEVLNKLKDQRIADPMNTRVRELLKRHHAGENAILPVVQEHILTRYFNIEVEMRREAKNIKSKTA